MSQWGRPQSGHFRTEGVAGSLNGSHHDTSGWRTHRGCERLTPSRYRGSKLNGLMRSEPGAGIEHSQSKGYVGLRSAKPEARCCARPPEDEGQRLPIRSAPRSDRELSSFVRGTLCRAEAAASAVRPWDDARCAIGFVARRGHSSNCRLPRAAANRRQALHENVRLFSTPTPGLFGVDPVPATVGS